MFTVNNLPPAKRLFRLSTCKTEHNLVGTREKESIDTMYLNAATSLNSLRS